MYPNFFCLDFICPNGLFTLIFVSHTFVCLNIILHNDMSILHIAVYDNKCNNII